MWEVELVTDDAQLLALEAEWRAIFEAAPHLTPFQSWKWCTLWRRHHPEGALHVLLLRRNSSAAGTSTGELRAILPLVRTTWRGTPVRQLRFFGAPLSDYQELVARAEDAPVAARLFLDHLTTHCSGWDLADLNDLRRGSALLEAASGATLQGGAGFHRRCPVIALPPTWEEYHKTLGKNLRANLGRRRRQLERDHGLVLETVSQPEALHEAMEELFALHNHRWQKRGASGAFSTARLRAFHHEVARLFLARGWLRLHRLRADGRTHACFYCFSRGGRVYYYLSGFREELALYSPGLVLMGYAVQQAIAEGARAFDLLRGDEGYKYLWQATDETTERLVLGHGTLRSRLGLGGHRLERFIERRGLQMQHLLWGRRSGHLRAGSGANATEGTTAPDQQRSTRHPDEQREATREPRRSSQRARPPRTQAGPSSQPPTEAPSVGAPSEEASPAEARTADRPRRSKGPKGLGTLLLVLALLLLPRSPALAVPSRPAPLQTLSPSVLRELAPLAKSADVVLIESTASGIMRQLTTVALVAAAPQVVYDVVSHPERYPEFVRNTKRNSVERTPEGQLDHRYTYSYGIYTVDGHHRYALLPPPEEGAPGAVEIFDPDEDGVRHYRFEFLPALGGTLVVLYGYTAIPRDSFMERFLRAANTLEHGLALITQLTLMRSMVDRADALGGHPPLASPPPGQGGSYAALLKRGAVALLRSSGGRIQELSLIARSTARPEVFTQVAGDPLRWSEFIPTVKQSISLGAKGGLPRVELEQALPLMSWLTTFGWRTAPRVAELVGLEGDLRDGRLRFDVRPDGRGAEVVLRTALRWDTSSMVLRQLYKLEPLLDSGIQVGLGLVLLEGLRTEAEKQTRTAAPLPGEGAAGSH